MNTEKIMHCHTCNEVTAFTLQRHYTASAVLMIRWTCTQCHSRKGNSEGVKRLETLGIDVYRDIRLCTRDLHFEVCDVCGALGAEYQHWAPRKYFGNDADRWPTGFLCRKCHAEWHSKVTGDLINDNVPTFDELLSIDEELRQWYEGQRHIVDFDFPY